MTTKAEGINARVLKNSVALLASQGYITVTALILATQLPRYLGEVEYGRYSEIYAFVALFEVVGQMGLRVILTREAARHRQQAMSILGQVLILKLPLAAAAFAIVMAAAFVQPITPLERFLIAICIAESLIRGYANTINGILRAFELMEYNLVITVVDRTLAVGAVLATIYLKLDLTAVFAAFLLSGVGRLLVTAVLCRWRAGKPAWGADVGTWKQFLRETWPVGASDALTRAYAGAGLVQLGASDGATGLFAGALRISQLTTVLGTSVADALFPVLSRASHQSPDQLRRIARNGLSLLLALALPFAAFYLVFGDLFVPWFLGTEFAPAASALLILSPTLVLGFVRLYFSSLLQASNRQRWNMLAMLVTLVVNVATNAILIPCLDFIGAAWALVAAEGAYLLCVLLAPGQPLNALDLGHALLPAAAGTAGCVAAWLLLAPLTLWVCLPLGAALYLAIWLLVARANRELWAFLLRLWDDVRNRIRALASARVSKRR
jgi:O-antigen/teichoic acid export membrane protein